MKFANFNIKEQILTRFRNRRIMKIMRGEALLKREGKQDKISLINEIICNQEINQRVDAVPKLNISSLEIELPYRQFLLVKFGGYNLTPLLLKNIGTKGRHGNIYPIPRSWRKIISEHGILVNNTLSDIFWQLRLFHYGTTNTLRVIKILISKCEHPKSIWSSNFAVFFSIPKQISVMDGEALNAYHVLSDVPQVECFSQNRLIVAEGSFQNSKLENCYGNQVIFTKSFWSSILTLSEKIKLTFALLLLLYTSLKYALCGNLTNFLFIREIFLAQLVTRFENKFISKSFYFNNAAYIYRPFWTHFIDKPNDQVTMYFHSSNIQQFSKVKAKKPDRMHFGYKTMNWPRYLVWDKSQASFLEQINRYKQIEIVGPIEFGGKEVPKNIMPSKVLALFDVPPVRKSAYSSLAPEFDYYTYENGKKFIEDVVKAASKFNYIIAYKTKRPSSKISHKGYESFVRKLGLDNENFIMIDPSVAASSIIKNSELVISMPFTSTALLGKKWLKESIYYNPTSMLEEFEPGSASISVLHGVNQLEKYIQTININDS